MEDSKIFSKKYTNPLIRRTLRPRICGMNTDLLMIWLPMPLSQMEDLYGLAKTMMVMFNQIS